MRSINPSKTPTELRGWADSTADFLTSLKAILIPMLILLAGLVIDSAVLLHATFPDIHPVARVLASILLGFALAFPLLLTSVNSKMLPSVGWLDFPRVFGFCTVLLSLFFFDVFSWKDQHWSRYFLAGFLSVLFGIIEYLYSFLFIRKVQEVTSQRDTAAELASAQATVTETQKLLSEAKAALTERTAALTDALAELTEHRRNLTCPHCTQVLKSPGAHRNHVNRCTHNPKNQH